MGRQSDHPIGRGQLMIIRRTGIKHSYFKTRGECQLTRMKNIEKNFELKPYRLYPDYIDQHDCFTDCFYSYEYEEWPGRRKNNEKNGIIPSLDMNNI